MRDQAGGLEAKDSRTHLTRRGTKSIHGVSWRSSFYSDVWNGFLNNPERSLEDKRNYFKRSQLLHSNRCDIMYLIHAAVKEVT